MTVHERAHFIKTVYFILTFISIFDRVFSHDRTISTYNELRKKDAGYEEDPIYKKV